MTATIELSGLEFSHRLFRLAKVQVWRANRCAAASVGSAPQIPSSAERECVTSAVSLTAAAADDWVTWASLATRVPLPRQTDSRGWYGLVARWRTLPQVARATGRSAEFRIGEARETFLADLGAWNAALQYADPEGRWMVQKRLAALGLIDGREAEGHLVSADLAARMVAEATALFVWAASVTGLPTPASPRSVVARIAHAAA